MNVELESEEYFITEKQKKSLQKEQEKVLKEEPLETKFGTVGAVALDKDGNLAAATSTGGITNKKYSRIGDSPLIGIGNYANNETCAISCTGDGEFFIRSVVAYDVSCLMEYKGLSLKEACEIVIHDKVKKLGGEGGLIAIDKNGNIELPFNTGRMARGFKTLKEEFTGVYE
jgi:beta-aspartyl-peptidase (threonine type)